MADRTVAVTLVGKVQGFVSAMDRAKESVDKLSGAADTVGDKEKSFKAAGAGAMVMAGAVTAAWALSVNAAKNFDKAMSDVAATGAQAQAQIGELRAAAIAAGRDTQFGATEAAGGITALLKAGVSATDALHGGLTGALDLAAAGEIQVADAAEIASTAMTQFGLSGKDVPHIADLLASGANKAQGGVGDLAAALKQGGLVASQFGLGVEETVGTLSAFASAGLLGSDAGTSFKSMLLKLASPSKEASRLMDDLGIAAYDTGGQFVGVAGLAEQLKTKLGGLSAQQRDSALATIFGTDAIRAANILYTQGAAGIQDWTSKVNESGFAGQVAATLLDNLSGDLTKLKGSVETMFISLGEGSQGPLRWAVQGITDLVNVISDNAAIAGWLLSAGAGLAALGLAAAAVYKTVTAIAAMKVALEALNLSLTTVAKGAGWIAAIGAAVTGLVAVYGWLTKSSHDVADAQQDYASTLDTTTKAITDQTRALAADRLEKSGALSSAKTLGIALSDVTDAALGNADAMGRVQAAATAAKNASHDQADALVDQQTAIRAVLDAQMQGEEQRQRIAKSYGLEGQSIEDLEARYNSLTGEITAARSTVDARREAGDALVKQLGTEKQGLDQALQSEQRKKEATQATADATKASADATKASADATAASVALTAQEQQQVEAAGKAKKEAADQTRALTQEVQTYANALISLSGSQIGVERALGSLAKRAQESHKEIKAGADVLDITTEAGQKNQEALNGVGTAATRLIATMREQGATTEQITAATDRQRGQFIAQATAMGVSKTKAEELAAAYFAIPGRVTTDTVLNHFQSSRDADALKAKLNKLSEPQRAEVMAVLQSQGVDAAEARLASLSRTRTASVMVHIASDGSSVRFPGGNVATLAAGGGLITGPGTSTSDSIPAMLSNGEYVVRAAAVRALGPDRLHYLNRTGRLPRFASGGMVGRPQPAPAPSWSSTDIASAVRDGMSSAAVTVDISLDGRPIDARISAALSATARGARR